jgi:SAM-dependent methyltransferase
VAVSERFHGANVIDAGRLSPYWGEHIVRYLFASSFVQNKSVLDIACGTGYGISILKSRAKHVTGVDVDSQAALEALVECDEKAAVLLGDGLGLPFADRTFGAVTSFETLEHIHERGKFLAELHRVLQPSGKLILSTPNANYTMPIDGKPSNPFHVFEYKPEELREDLEKCFIIESFQGQTPDGSIKIPPFYDAQKRLPKDVVTQVMLFGWKVMNKIPFRQRERLSEAIWGKPFYPSENDYVFSPETVDHAPVLVAVCTRKDL